MLPSFIDPRTERLKKGELRTHVREDGTTERRS